MSPLSKLPHCCLLLSPHQAGGGRGATAGSRGEQVTLDNGTLQADVYLPGGGGYYRGHRFDHSGHVAEVRVGRTRFFGPWKPHMSGDDHDDVVGTAEEFSMDAPPGFAEAGEGGAFMKIGVGMLRREREREYRFQDPQVLLDAGAWHVERGGDFVQAVHVLAHESGWGYRYTKRVCLVAGEPALRIERLLENTGRRTIDTRHYAHNFVQVDAEPIGPRYELRLPFDATPAADPPPRLAGVATLEGGVLRFTGPIRKDIWVRLAGLTGTAEDHGFEVRHASGARIRAAGDGPVVEYRIWGSAMSLCPEPFVAVRAEPGGSARWATQYEFVGRS